MRWCLAFLMGLASLAPGSAGEAPPLPVKQSNWMVGPIDLDPARLNQMPAGSFSMSFPEPVWLLGYRTKIVDDAGKTLDKDLNCHTMFKSLYADEWLGHNGKPFKGLFSDGYTNDLHVPAGFGIPYDAGETIEIIPMFNNRDRGVVRAGMQATIDYVPAKDLTRPLKPLFSMVQSVVIPHLYLVNPGQDVRELEFKFPFDGTLHMIGVHIHPYGKSVELINESREESVWNAVAERNAEGRVQRMPVYSSAAGYHVRADERYRIRAIYDNPTQRQQDAMAGLVIFFATDDGKMPQPPPGSVPRPAGAHDHDH